MLISYKLVTIFVLCSIGATLSSPTEHVAQARGIGSWLWGWLTYPFTWWGGSSGQSTEANIETATSVFTHDNNIEIAKHNITVWCNDQMCTTMKCDKTGCNNVTCNIYDTDMSGVCREYTTKPDNELHTSSLQTTQATEEPKKTTEAVTEVPPAAVTNLGVEERPLELEAVLSSTVPIDDKNKDEDTSD